MWTSMGGSGANPWLSLGMSIISLSLTLYFWLIKTKREAPSLVLDSVAQHSFIDLGRGSDEVRWLQIRLGVVVANMSILPNAALDIQLYQRPADSEQWFKVENVYLVEGTQLPVNLPPMQTGLITVEWWQSFPTLREAESQEANKIAGAYLDFYFRRRTLQVEVTGIKDVRFVSEVAIKNVSPPMLIRRAA